MCQIASFNNRLSIVSNLIISLFGLGFMAILIRHAVAPVSVDVIGDFDTTTHYIVGLFKMILMYIISDKIHTSQMMLSILYRYSQSIRFLNIEIDEDTPKLRYPLIFIDGVMISTTRYRVTEYEKTVNVIFNPPLSIGDDTIIEYEMIEEDATHVISEQKEFDIYTKPACMFRCHVVVRNKNKEVY